MMEQLAQQGPWGHPCTLTVPLRAPVPPCLGDEVGVAHDGADEEAVVGGLGARLHPGSSQVEVHPVAGTGDGRQLEVPHAAQLQLESERRLQVPVDPILRELSGTAVSQGGAGAAPALPPPDLTSSLALNVKNLGNSLCSKREREDNVNRPGSQRIVLILH